jgi:hypothetical protein
MTAVAIASVLAAISLLILLALLVRWRVEATADQLAAGMRLAHANATRQLTDWHLVLMPDGRPLAACSNADYCLVKLKNAYVGGGPPALDPPLMLRELPEGTRIREVTCEADCSVGDSNAAVPPSSCGREPTRPIEFNPNGTVRTLRPGGSGTVGVSSDDGSPSCGLVFQAATTRVRVGPIVYE